MSLRAILKRIPFTLVMVAVLLFAAWWTSSYYQELAREWVSRFGFAPHDFWLFRWERLVLSALVTSGGGIFWFALAMVAFTSGIVEWTSGGGRAMAAFWGVHLATLLSESLIFRLPLHQFGFTQARAVFFSRDVGPSAGYMGSLGWATSLLPKPWRWVIFTAILVFLVISLFLPPRVGETEAVKLSAGIAHLLAYSIGMTAALLFGRKKNFE